MAPPSASSRVSRRELLRALAGAGVGAAAGVGIHGYAHERHDLTITRTTLPVLGLPEAFDGMRVALLTDFHRSPLVSHEDVSRAVAAARAEAPDLIVLGGDYVTWGHDAFLEPVAEALAPLTAPLGVYAILGNHDSDPETAVALERRGFTVLRDARTTLRHRGDELDLIGIRYWTKQVSTIAKLLGEGGRPQILLAHDPRRLNEAAELNVPLVLSGHTHGGQIVLPGFGAWNRGMFPVMQGTLQRENTTLFVSRGIGMVYVPLRLNCPPEVALITLERRGLQP